MPKEANVAIFEDDSRTINVLVEVLEENGHSIVSIARSPLAACELIKNLESKKIDVAVIDGNLGDGDDDGAQIVELLRKSLPGVPTIGFTTDDKGVKNATLQVSKVEVNNPFQAVADLITSL